LEFVIWDFRRYALCSTPDANILIKEEGET
jgi:hypothetical protein